ncbi:MAG: hypothetical protein ACI9TY_001256 [Alphaproteobacteria bacterium]|jgi:hypothetical protein
MDTMQNLTKVQAPETIMTNVEAVSVEGVLCKIVASQEMQDILSMLKQEGLANQSLDMKVQNRTAKVH